MDTSLENIEELKTLRLELETVIDEKTALEKQVAELVLQVQEMGDLRKELAIVKVWFFYCFIICEDIYLNFK